jgi:hypothetical protein
MDLVEHHYKEAQQLISGRTDIREALDSRDRQAFFRRWKERKKLGLGGLTFEIGVQGLIAQTIRHVLPHVVFGKADRPRLKKLFTDVDHFDFWSIHTAYPIPLSLWSRRLFDCVYSNRSLNYRNVLVVIDVRPNFACCIDSSFISITITTLTSLTLTIPFISPFFHFGIPFRLSIPNVISSRPSSPVDKSRGYATL